MNNKIIKIGLSVTIVVLILLIINTILTPIRFQEQMVERKKEVIQRLKDIREAQIAYKKVKGVYCNNFDSLLCFLKNEKIVFIDKVGADDDTLAIQSGDRNRWRRDTILVNAFESIEYYKVDSLRDGYKFILDSLPYIPFSVGQKFNLQTAKVMTASGVEVPVFEAYAPNETFLRGLDGDYKKSEGLRVGSITEANNNAGNWD